MSLINTASCAGAISFDFLIKLRCHARNWSPAFCMYATELP